MYPEIETEFNGDVNEENVSQVMKKYQELLWESQIDCQEPMLDK